MSTRVEQIVIGIIVLLVGVFIIMGGRLSFDLGGVMLAAIGAGFILMYITKRKSWALVLGAYLACFGITASLRYGYGPPIVLRVGEYLESSLMMITTGLVCMALFYDKNKRGLLIPGALILGMCAKWFVRDVLLMDYRWISTFAYSASFYVIYVFGSYFLGRWPKTVSAVLFVAGIFTMLRG